MLMAVQPLWAYETDQFTVPDTKPAANMAGFYFYQNLFAPITLNNQVYPALL
jgi:hypothetical protein